MRPAFLTRTSLLFSMITLAACATLEDSSVGRYLGAPRPAPVLQAPPPGPPFDETRAERAPPAPAPSVLIRAVSAVPTGPEDLMERIRFGFQLAEEERPAINIQLAWYERNPAYLDRVFGRASLYMHHIVEEIERRKMPMELALLPVIESAFEPFAYSKARASGLWQFIPDTGSRFGLPQNWWYDGRRDVIESTRAALDYLQFLHDEFDGDWLLAVAGYNCGENCIARAVARNRAAGKPTTFWDLRLPNETRAYVPKLLAMKQLVADPSVFGVEFSPIPNQPYFMEVALASQIDLRLAADLAGLSHDELVELNPAYHRWATPPEGPHGLLLPIDSTEIFQQRVTLLSPDELMRVTHHIVKPGESIPELAKRYGTTVVTIRMLNGLKNANVYPGTDLRVPSGTMNLPEKVLRAAARVDGPTPRTRGKRNRPEIHVVRRGESVWAIARRNNMDPRTLMRLNGKKPGDRIMPGERLVLSRSGSNSSSAGPRTMHRVRSGETLSGIARRYGVTVTQLLRWNDLSSKNVLRIGQRLVIRRGN
ncbi:MAG: LysM peptidoglycan-binding domain-containing protein [Gammaproteobacteria bacterium]|nr:LysM peptidoglycan-binding domain-containing protein [Gammaproteobacteria bacterium]